MTSGVPASSSERAASPGSAAPPAVEPTEGPDPATDFAALYDRHPEYRARRAPGSFEQAQVDLEVRLFKLPNLLRVWPGSPPQSVLEIGCATGELIAAMPVVQGGRKLGVDISPANIEAARARFPQVEFACGDVAALPASAFDAVVLSDVLEHVPDDVAFLREAARLGRTVLVNLPLENNWLNRRRRYGPGDVSGHLRKYSLGEGLALIEHAGLAVLAHAQVWVHETPAEPARRALRQAAHGAAYAGPWPARALRRAVLALARAVRPLGRRLFASNLFVAARAGAPAADLPGPRVSPPGRPKVEHRSAPHDG